MTSYSLKDYWKKQKDNLVKTKNLIKKEITSYKNIYIYIYTYSTYSNGQKYRKKKAQRRTDFVSVGILIESMVPCV